MQIPKTYDFSGVPDCAIPEFYRQAELYLDNLVKIGLAADARATTSSNIFGAGAIASFAVAANLFNSNPPHVQISFSIMLAAIFLMLAALLCALAARPKSFFHPGHQPDLLFKAAASETSIKRGMSQEIQERIDANMLSLRLAADQLRWGQNLAALAPVAFLATFFGYTIRL